LPACRLGADIVTSGPAITNTLAAVADSFADSGPLVVIAGQVPEHRIGTNSFQHLDVASVFRPTAKSGNRPCRHGTGPMYRIVES